MSEEDRLALAMFQYLAFGQVRVEAWFAAGAKTMWLMSRPDTEERFTMVFPAMIQKRQFGRKKGGRK